MAIYTHTLMECFNKAIQVAHKELAAFTGATGTTSGTKGAVPAPSTGDVAKFLRGDGTWASVYEVGDIYLSLTNANPAARFGGTWTQIAGGRCLIGASSTYSPGDTGGSETHTMTVSEMPSHSHGGTVDSAGGHTHSRGTMNISGTMGGLQTEYDHPSSYYSGAFSVSIYHGHTDGSNGGDRCAKITMNAADGWSGETSNSGSHTHNITTAATGAGTAFNIQNPYLVVYIWQRTA